MEAWSVWKAFAAPILAIALAGCTDRAREAFDQSQHGIRIGMTSGEVFNSGLADYLISASPKNVAGATVAEHQPASDNCPRHVLDVSYSTRFVVRVYCGHNEPSARMIVPEKSFANKQQLVQALDNFYEPVARDMEFRIESPPHQMFGIFDYFLVRIGADGRVSFVSGIYRARRNGAQRQTITFGNETGVVDREVR